LWKEYGEQVQFLIVYVREAHALDGNLPLGGGGMPMVEEPVTLDERFEVAQTCAVNLDLEPMPMVVDNLADQTCRDYSAWPDRMFLVGTDGRIAYRGASGPYGFFPDELGAAIRTELGRE
jgi:hypothetical protein